MTRSSDALVALDAADGATETIAAPPPTPGTVRYAAVRGYLALLETIAREHGLSLAEMFDGSKARRNVVARERAAAALRAKGATVAEVGDVLGLTRRGAYRLLARVR